MAVTKIAHHSVICVVAAASLFGIVALSSSAWAQKPDSEQTTPPQPSPTPNPQPAPNPNPPPAPFQSPFDKTAPTAGESVEFDKLVELYGKLQDAHAATLCATSDQYGAALEAERKARDAFEQAENQFVLDYSNNVYPPDTKNFTFGNRLDYASKFNADVAKVNEAIKKAYKGKHSAVCPPPPKASEPPNEPAPIVPPARPVTKTTPPKTGTTPTPKHRPKLKKHRHGRVTEDNPLYMEGFKPPANPTGGPRPDDSGHSSGRPPERPQEDEGGQGDSTPDNPYSKPPEVPMPGP